MVNEWKKEKRVICPVIALAETPGLV